MFMFLKAEAQAELEKRVHGSTDELSLMRAMDGLIALSRQAGIWVDKA